MAGCQSSGAPASRKPITLSLPPDTADITGFRACGCRVRADHDINAVVIRLDCGTELVFGLPQALDLVLRLIGSIARLRRWENAA